MRWLAVIFTMIISFNVWYSCSYLIYFHINQEEIIQSYCENIDYPELECNGQCHLAKQLAIVKEQNQQDAEGKIIGYKSLLTPVYKSLTLDYSLSPKSLKSLEIDAAFIVPKLRSYQNKIMAPPKGMYV